jgi:serine/threonine-protein kinase
MHEGEPFDSASLTSSGAMLGTPCYMAPEQGFGEPDIDHRADVWALGAILYECLSGGRPVEGDNLGQVLKRLLSEGITPLDRVLPGTPADVAELVAHMLAPNRSERLANLDGVAAVLERYSNDVALRDVSASRAVVPIRKRKLSRSQTAAAAALILALVASVVVGARHRRPTNTTSGETPLPAPRETATEASRTRPSDKGAPTVSAGGVATSAPVAAAARNTSTSAAPTPSMNDDSRSLAMRAHRRVQPSATTSAASPPPSSTILGGLVEKPPF